MPGSRRLLCLVLLVLFSAASAFAQFTSSVQGAVQDPTGAGVANARVQLANVATNAVQTTNSDEAGNFRFLRPGSRLLQSYARSDRLQQVRGRHNAFDRTKLERAGHAEG